MRFKELFHQMLMEAIILNTLRLQTDVPYETVLIVSGFDCDQNRSGTVIYTHSASKLHCCFSARRWLARVRIPDSFLGTDQQ